MVTRTTPLPNRAVGAPGVTRWIGGVDTHPGTEGPDGIDETSVALGPAAMVDLYDLEGAPAGSLVWLEIYAPSGDDILWVCLGGEYAHARAWPIHGGERFEHTAHLQGIDQISLRATAANGTDNPSAAIKPRIRAEWDRRG